MKWSSRQVDDPSLFAELLEFFGYKGRSIVSNDGMCEPQNNVKSPATVSQWYSSRKLTA